MPLPPQRPHKVCPVVLRQRGDHLDILAFEHPLAGCQLVKGTIEPREPVGVAALRELAEESGITTAVVTHDLGLWPSNHQGQLWAFVRCHVDGDLPDTWTHQAPDDGGHTFRFFWHPLDAAAHPDRWHPLFIDALAQVALRSTTP